MLVEGGAGSDEDLVLPLGTLNTYDDQNTNH